MGRIIIPRPRGGGTQRFFREGVQLKPRTTGKFGQKEMDFLLGAIDQAVMIGSRLYKEGSQGSLGPDAERAQGLAEARGLKIKEYTDDGMPADEARKRALQDEGYAPRADAADAALVKSGDPGAGPRGFAGRQPDNFALAQPERVQPPGSGSRVVGTGSVAPEEEFGLGMLAGAQTYRDHHAAQQAAIQPMLSDYAQGISSRDSGYNLPGTTLASGGAGIQPILRSDITEQRPGSPGNPTQLQPIAPITREDVAWHDVATSPDMDLTYQLAPQRAREALARTAPVTQAPQQQPAPPATKATEDLVAKQYLSTLPPERQNRVAAAAKQLVEQQGGDLRTVLLRVAMAEKKAIDDAEARKSRRLNLFGRDEGQLRVLFHSATDTKQRLRIMQAVSDTAVAGGWNDWVQGTHIREAQERVAKGYTGEKNKKETPLSKRIAELMLMESKTMGYRGRERRAQELHAPALGKINEATRKLKLANDKAAEKLFAVAKRQPAGGSKIIEQAAFWMYYHKRRNLITDEQWRKGAGPFHEATSRASLILKAETAGASKKSLGIIHKATQRMPTDPKTKAPKDAKPPTEAERTRSAVINLGVPWAIGLMGNMDSIESPIHLKLRAADHLETGNWSGLMDTLSELQGAVDDDLDVPKEDAKRLKKLVEAVSEKAVGGEADLGTYDVRSGTITPPPGQPE